MNAIDILAESKLFGRMDKRHLEKLAEIAKVTTHVGGDRLVKQGAEDENIYVLGTGSVRVLRERGDGETDEVSRLGPGSALGEVAFVDQQPRSTTVVAAEKTDVLTLEAAKLKKLLKGDPVLRASFYWRLATVLAHRLRGATKDLSSMKAVLDHH